MVQYNILLNFTQRGFSESITSIVRSSSWLWKRNNTSAKVMTYRAESKHVFLQLGEGFLKRENYRINVFRKCLFNT